MKIGELALRSGLAASKIRFYEAQGLIRKVHRQANGYREYPPEVLQTLSIIQCAQQAGFSLEELRALVPATESEVWDHAEMIASLERKIGRASQPGAQDRPDRDHAGASGPEQVAVAWGGEQHSEQAGGGLVPGKCRTHDGVVNGLSPRPVERQGQAVERVAIFVEFPPFHDLK